MNSPGPRSLVEILKRAVSSHPDESVIRFKVDKKWVGLSGRDLMDRVSRTALGLYSLGVRKGDRVAMLAESGPLWSISDYAILSNGAMNVPIYPTQSVQQVEYIIRESDPRLLLISTARQLKRVEAALKKFPHLRIVTFQAVEDGESITSLEAVEATGAALAEREPELFDLISSDVQSSDLASIIYTSGTTGEPKGVMLTHSNIVSNALAAGTFLSIERGNRMLSFLPMSHIFERTVLYLCMHFGVEINFAGGLETVAGDLREVRPTLMSTVPRLLEKIYARVSKTAADGGKARKTIFEWASNVARGVASRQTENRGIPPLLQLQRELADPLVFARLREALGGRMKRLVSGGAALSPDLAQFFIGAGIPILQGYGLTETSPVIAVCSLEHNRTGSVGKVLPGVEVKIAEDGEILTRGPHVFHGYFNKPEETTDVFEPVPGSNGDVGPEERWFRTGDIGYLDAEGYLHITDRKKDLIKTSAGKYVAPQFIEGLINRSEFVEQSIVIGNSRKYVSALIVPDFERLRAWAATEGLAVSDRDGLVREKRVFDLYRTEVSRLTRDVADFERIKRLAVLPREFSVEGGELTPTLKVRRRIVESQYGDLIDSLYGGGADN